MSEHQLNEMISEALAGLRSTPLCLLDYIESWERRIELAQRASR